MSCRCGCRGGRGITGHAPVLRTHCWAVATSPSAVCHRERGARGVSSEWWTFDPSLHGPMLLPTALTLMGSVVCVMSMSVLSSVGNTRGSYPLFKPGASSLGGSCVQVELSIQPKRLADCKGLTHEMEISVRSVCVRGAERGVVSTELDSPPPCVLSGLFRHSFNSAVFLPLPWRSGSGGGRGGKGGCTGRETETAGSCKLV